MVAATGVRVNAIAPGVTHTGMTRSGSPEPPRSTCSSYLATVGTLCLLVMYVLTNVAAARHLGRPSRRQVLMSAVGALVACFVLYHSVWPLPPPPSQLLPYLGWLPPG
jgi:NAD(P)-dependent dehydrogenase (short-subunit alcohol dehydrogenase family)